MGFLEWLRDEAGTIMTVGGSVVVAIIGTGAAVRARRVREPVPFKDIWEENRKTRLEADTERDENQALVRAVTVMWRYINRLLDAWGAPTIPKLSPADKAVIDRVIDDAVTPGRGTPAVVDPL